MVWRSDQPRVGGEGDDDLESEQKVQCEHCESHNNDGDDDQPQR